jgi:hypothetical protein
MTAGVASGRESAEGTLRVRIGRWPRSPVFYGIVVAVVAGVAGQYLHVSPPAAYGLCSACHGRDLVDWLLNHVEGAKLYVAAAGVRWPLLTVVGLVLGSFAAARRNGEFGSIDTGGDDRLVRLARRRADRRLPRPALAHVHDRRAAGVRPRPLRERHTERGRRRMARRSWRSRA